MLHVPVNNAPGSMANFEVKISPLILAVLFNDNISETSIFPFISPLITAFKLVTLPSNKPLSPNTNLPFVMILPVN